MAAEHIEILDLVELIYPTKKPELEITLKKLEPYDQANQAIADEFIEPMEPPEILPD